MQWQTTTMITWGQWHIGGAMLWSRTRLTGNWWVHVIFTGRRNLMSVSQCIAMPWIKNSVTLISTTSMLLLATTLMVVPLPPATPCTYLTDPIRYQFNFHYYYLPPTVINLIHQINTPSSITVSFKYVVGDLIFNSAYVKSR